MTRKLAGAAIMIVLAGVGAGCGGDDKSDPSSGSAGAGAATTASDAPLTKAAYIKAADAICAQANTKIQAGAAKLRTAATKDGTLEKTEVVKFFKQTSLPAYEAMVMALGGLAAPTSDEAKVDGFVAAVAAAIDVVKAEPAKFANRTADDPFDDANKRAREYGMKVCGS